jgi:hypothetical protein
MNNGIPGIAIHSHTRFQNINHPVIVNNTLAGNGPDEDVPGDDDATGISIFSAVDPIVQTTVTNLLACDVGLASAIHDHASGEGGPYQGLR